jgi:hypothetical protein
MISDSRDRLVEFGAKAAALRRNIDKRERRRAGVLIH